MRLHRPEAQPPRPSPSRFGAHKLGAVVVLALALATVATSYQLSLGSLTAPGPGLWPFFSGVALVGCALFLLVRDPVADYEAWTARSGRIAAVLACLAVFIVLFQGVGLILPGMLLLAAWLRFFAREPWRLTAPLAVGIPVVYLLFDVALGVPFPPDVLGDTLRQLV